MKFLKSLLNLLGLQEVSLTEKEIRLIDLITNYMKDHDTLSISPLPAANDNFEIFCAFSNSIRSSCIASKLKDLGYKMTTISEDTYYRYTVEKV